jgi:hypothetical protein
MRKIVVLVGLLTLGAAQPTAPPRPVTTPPFPDCRTLHIADAVDKAPFRRLGELPPAEAYQAVLRVGPDGCSNPLTMRERISWTRLKPTK